MIPRVFRHGGPATTVEQNPTSDLVGNFIPDDKDLSSVIEDIPDGSGALRPSRAGYDENKCRNVLVRYCGHIPRNYQYKDGVQQIFLILREHLGDENLDLAGGVLYELIEIDCEHTDDPGAAFQRWRHDHLNRYNDLELPHVPHMSTITSSIIPTRRLVHWRADHPDRYPFVLSDSSASSDRTSTDPGCIRNRKAWMIDNTFYVSSRSGGTLPLHTPNPKEFHEMQWNSQFSNRGRLVEEREVPISLPNRRRSDSTPPGTSDSKNTSNIEGKSRGSLSRYSIGRLVEKVAKQKKEPVSEHSRRSWMSGGSWFDPASRRRSGSERVPVPLPDGQVPNAIFARKYLLVDEGDTLPPYLPISQMPIAESKANDMLVEAANSGLLEKESVWQFRGPFTPQLGYDGGLDYQWALRNSTVNPQPRRQAQSQEDEKIVAGESQSQWSRQASLSGSAQHNIREKRKAFRFDLDWDMELFMGKSGDTLKPMNSARPNDDKEQLGYISRWSSPLPTPRSQKSQPNIASQFGVDLNTNERSEMHRPGSLLFENVEFVMPKDLPGSHSPNSNRKTTIVQLSPPLLRGLSSISDLHQTHRICPAHRFSSTSNDSSYGSDDGERDGDDRMGCFECMKEDQKVSFVSQRPVVCEVRHAPRLFGISRETTPDSFRPTGLDSGPS